MSQFGRKAALGAVAFGMVGSTLFGGAALADTTTDDGNDVAVTATGGAGGWGGEGGKGGDHNTANPENSIFQYSEGNWSDDESTSGNQAATLNSSAAAGNGGYGGYGGAGGAAKADFDIKKDDDKKDDAEGRRQEGRRQEGRPQAALRAAVQAPGLVGGLHRHPKG